MPEEQQVPTVENQTPQKKEHGFHAVLSHKETKHTSYAFAKSKKELLKHVASLGDQDLAFCFQGKKMEIKAVTSLSLN